MRRENNTKGKPDRRWDEEVRGQSGEEEEEEDEEEGEERHSWKFIHPSMSADRNISAPSSLTEGLLSVDCSPLRQRGKKKERNKKKEKERNKARQRERKSQSGFRSLKFIMQIAELKCLRSASLISLSWPF